ncbi:MAG: M23 family metallopeptidase [Pseudomonadota bacterium]|nr:M23 family metallopeptidase [Pseudomonadota bacterium]MEC7236745.1 M23 family metallopeptidase [Pseudomonadota bacterium]
MTKLMDQILRRFTPKMLRSDSPDRPMVVRRRHWFLQETRFLFLTRKGPVEITVKPALILGAAFVGCVGTGVIAAATLFVGYKSVEVVTTDSITPAEASAPQMIMPVEEGAHPTLELAGTAFGTGLLANLSDDVNLPASPDASDTVTKLAMAVTPPPSWPPSLAATDAAPDIVALVPPTPAEPETPRWPPSLAATGTVAPITIPHHHSHQIFPDDEGHELAHNHDEPDTMVPLPSLAELAGLVLPDQTPTKPDIVDIPAVAVPQADNFAQDVETIAMLKAPPAPAALPPDDDFEMVPDSGGDLPVFSDESRQRKLLRSMAREVRGIRESLVQIGLPETVMPEIGTLRSYVETADFASLAMAVEDHRSMLRKVPLKPPMLYFYITSNYGWRKHPVLKKRRFHHGIDLAGTWQETVQAPAPGTVIFAGRKGSFGKVVQVQHAYGVVTTYAHLAKITVRKGADVVPGTVVGKMGRTGRVDGAHLHYEIRLGDKSFDPQLFFDIGHRIGVGGELMLATDQQ